jgi:hypothetical protein
VFYYNLQIIYIDIYTFNVKLDSNNISPFSNIKYNPDIANDYRLLVLLLEIKLLQEVIIMFISNYLINIII